MLNETGQFFYDIEQGKFFNEETGEKYDLKKINPCELIELYNQWVLTQKTTFVIKHPGTGERIENVTLEEAMDKYYEGFNPPIKKYPDDSVESTEQAMKRIKHFKNRESWLKGWSRIGSLVLMGTATYCAGCGKFHGVQTVVFPDWPFREESCPVCQDWEFTYW